MRELPRGPVMLGVDGLVLSEADRERLAHPLVGGVILFARNYEHPDQLAALTASIRALREPPLLIAVDHEGGRVQRFRDGFTPIPPMRTLGERWDRDVAGAAREAARLGWTIACELRAAGIDFSFGPVLDLDYGESTVIGDRALHRNPNAAAHLAAALHDGMRAGGMAAVGKHFPGHGFVAADSHFDIPIDERPFEAIAADDLVPFDALVRTVSRRHARARDLSCRRRAARGLFAHGCRTSCAAARLRRASIFPTTWAWRAPSRPATSSTGPRPRCRPAATWC